MYKKFFSKLIYFTSVNYHWPLLHSIIEFEYRSLFETFIIYLNVNLCKLTYISYLSFVLFRMFSR